MDREDIERLLDEFAADGEETMSTLLDMIRERNGNVSLVLRVLARRPDLAVPHVLKGMGRHRVLDPKTKELVGVAAAAALRCEYCIQAHAERALRFGATEEELFETLVVAGTVAESSTQAVAFRVFEKLRGRRRHRQDDGGADAGGHEHGTHPHLE
ncbi:MAG: carboxymuconolactone decarboxylase family protein [Chloroflexi bacterium]|nr:carboxymuconolactone decarboxylase family protein [Chloroflexota bacterium]